jgi:hypothetical protein
MGQLEDHEWRRAVEFMLLAGEHGVSCDYNGALPSISDIAWKLHATNEDIEKALTILSQLNITHFDNDAWYVTHFKDRQDADTEAERKRHEREWKQLNTYYENSHNAVTEDVTKRDGELKIESELNIEKEKEKELSAAASPPKQPRTAAEYKISVAKAMQRGFENNLNLETRVTRAFMITPNWHTKTNRAIMLWLKQRPEKETVEIFAEWWYSKDWRGKEKQPPNLAQMRELWPQAFKDGGDHKRYRGGEFDWVYQHAEDKAESTEEEEEE